MMDANNPIDWTGQKKVSLALQGGGSHGAFTWGVLDYLLEDGRLDIEAITGTSAGAMNAVVLAAARARAGASPNSGNQSATRGRFPPSSESSSLRFSVRRCSRWPRNGGPIFSPIMRALTTSIP
jgi:Patatin-like phospholipase